MAVIPTFISVVMPVYNAEEFLSKAIQSVLAQTYTNFEFVIIDDASTDQSVKIISSFNDSRIRCYSNDENLGVTASLNRGLRLANGDYIARMDADDVCLPERFEEQINYLNNHPNTLLVGTAVSTIDKNNLITGSYFPPGEPEVTKFALTMRFPFYHPTVMLRSSVLQLFDDWYTDKFGRGVEDYEFFSRIASLGDVANLDKILLLYRKHENSVTAGKQEQQNKRLNVVSKRNIEVLLQREFNSEILDISNLVNELDLLLHDKSKYYDDITLKRIKVEIGAFVCKGIFKVEKQLILNLLFKKKYFFWPFFFALPSIVIKRQIWTLRMCKKLREHK